MRFFCIKKPILRPPFSDVLNVHSPMPTTAMGVLALPDDPFMFAEFDDCSVFAGLLCMAELKRWKDIPSEEDDCSGGKPSFSE